ncbi:YibE/F family protein [[Clostridium] polysaccharolyticum]|uniref:Uncharacterized membrane protein n=1 Tax=[Clostridium] polysaccharolyticum TaxID=29364 RepID=A0A1I0DFE8_9FIRM|nr:YibE/F family protein [[Clostridium] polysaccharolyticum]SET30793.1 Uncharacterized membrane protein [[Clostridium] polysaccharolyticum]
MKWFGWFSSGTENGFDKKEAGIRLGVILVAVLLFVAAYGYVHGHLQVKKDKGVQKSTYEKAVVVELASEKVTKDSQYEGVLKGSQNIAIKLLTGEHKGEIHHITNYLTALYQIDCQKGTKIVVRLDERENGLINVGVYNYDREGILLGAIGVFVLLLGVIGGKKGFMSLLSLAYTLLMLFFVLIPALYYGAPLLPATIGVIILTSIISFALIDGINQKTISGFLGTSAGVLFAGLFAYIMGKMTHISGFQTNEAESLMLECYDYGLQITNIFTAGILVSALGAVMDVAMSIASAIKELATLNPELKAVDLFRSGMNIGRDAMGTMSNTLILAFAGSSLSLLIMIYSYQIPLTQLLSTDLVAREVIQGISGSIGIIMTVPLVALSASIIMRKKTH